MNVEAGKCKCGCGRATLQWGDYLPGHDLKHRNELVERAGGVDKLAELLGLVETYMAGEIMEGELGKGIRRLRARR